MDTDRIPSDVRADVVTRLRRAEGQLRAVTRMLEEGSDCQAVLRQMSAAKSAVSRAGVRLLSAGLQECLLDARDGDLTPADFQKLFVELS